MTAIKERKHPVACENIADIRKEIDAIDHEIINLFGLRFEYVKHVVKYKEKNVDSIVATERLEAVIKKRREWACENELPADLFEGFYRKLIAYFIAEEMKILNVESNKKAE